jgi:hypothetical protein
VTPKKPSFVPVFVRFLALFLILVPVGQAQEAHQLVFPQPRETVARDDGVQEVAAVRVHLRRLLVARRRAQREPDVAGDVGRDLQEQLLRARAPDLEEAELVGPV